MPRTTGSVGSVWERPGARFGTALNSTASEMVKDVTEMGLEVCCTLGLLTESQAWRLEAGLTPTTTIHTSENHYCSVITTRTYQDRLDTIRTCGKPASRFAPAESCLGELTTAGPRLRTLATMKPHPETARSTSPKVRGTPLESQPDVLRRALRMIATARLMPGSVVRSAGRSCLGVSEQIFRPAPLHLFERNQEHADEAVRRLRFRPPNAAVLGLEWVPFVR